MKLAIYIHLHKEPDKALFLINNLQHELIDIFISIDNKSNKSEFCELIEDPRIIYIENKLDIYWGYYSIVKNNISAFKYISNYNTYDYILTLSGDCFPLKNTQSLLDYLNLNKGAEFIDIRTSSSEWDFSKRITKYHFNSYNKYMRKLLYILMSPFDRKYPYPQYQLGGGSQWFCLSLKCINYILTFIDNHPLFLEFHKYSSCSDEFFFHTIILNSGFSAKLMPLLHYIDWSENKSSPRILSVSDYEKCIKSEKFFCRKVSSEFAQYLSIIK